MEQMSAIVISRWESVRGIVPYSRGASCERLLYGQKLVSDEERLGALYRKCYHQPINRSSATHCQLTSNHPRLCPSSVDVFKRSFIVSLFLTQFCDSDSPSWTS